MTAAGSDKPRGPRGSLRRQLILYFTLSSLVVLALGFYFTYAQVMRIVENQNEKLLLQQLGQAGYNITGALGETDRLMQLFMKDDRVDAFIQSDIHDKSFESLSAVKDVLDGISGFIDSHRFIDSIYFFTDDFGEVGRNARNIIIERSGKPVFFASGFYRDTLARYPETVKTFGYNDKFYNPNLLDPDIHLFSVAKIVKSKSRSSKTAIIVFNIGERYIASLYAGEGGVSRMYIVDGGGTVVSSGDGEGIGSQSAVLNEIANRGGASGSFVSKTGPAQVQTVFCRIEGTDWYLVGEIPLKVFSADVAVLQRILAVAFLASVAVLFTASFFWLKRITRPLNVLADRMRDVGSGKLGVTLPKIPANEIGVVVGRFNEMSLNIAGLVRRNEEMQEEKRRLEIEALQAQINPHFIYNTLNMIKWMALMAKSKNIADSVVSLGKLLMPAFRSMDAMCALREEIDYIENYLNIMNWRFGNGITLEIDVPEELTGAMAPRFILQPVLENSIIHGLRKPENRIDIAVRARREGGVLLISIEDNGTGIPAGELEAIRRGMSGGHGQRASEEGSIGLYNVNRRICLNFGSEYGLHLESREGEGTRVTIRLPLVTASGGQA